MNIEKRASGSYRIRMQFKGKIYRLTLDHKPTQKEAMRLMSEMLETETTARKKMNFEKAANDYIEAKRNVLSQSTIRSYLGMLKTMSKEFRHTPLTQIGQVEVQTEINHLCDPYTVNYNFGESEQKIRTPKTIRNYHGFMYAVLSFYNPSIKLNTRLPQKKRKECYIPSTDDVKAILGAVKGSEYEIPIRLACYGMRRSEICALTLDDIDGDLVTINKAKIRDENGEWLIKQNTKTTMSERVIAIDQELADLIRERGYIYKGHPDQITTHLRRTADRLGIEEFSIHKLRHYFASILSGKVADEDIMALGGWASDHVMKTVYRHAMSAKSEEGKRAAAGALKDILSQ